MFVIQYIMPLCVVISFIYSVAILVQSIVYEKEQRLKEVMMTMVNIPTIQFIGRLGSSPVLLEC